MSDESPAVVGAGAREVNVGLVGDPNARRAGTSQPSAIRAMDGWS